jgi:hypothetical protein
MVLPPRARARLAFSEYTRVKSQAFNQTKRSLEAEMAETRPEFFGGSGHPNASKI